MLSEQIKVEPTATIPTAPMAELLFKRRSLLCHTFRPPKSERFNSGFLQILPKTNAKEESVSKYQEITHDRYQRQNSTLFNAKSSEYSVTNLFSVQNPQQKKKGTVIEMGSKQ